MIVIKGQESFRVNAKCCPYYKDFMPSIWLYTIHYQVSTFTWTLNSVALSPKNPCLKQFHSPGYLQTDQDSDRERLALLAAALRRSQSTGDLEDHDPDGADPGDDHRGRPLDLGQSSIELEVREYFSGYQNCQGSQKITYNREVVLQSLTILGWECGSSVVS